MRTTDLVTPRGNERVTPHLTSLLYRSRRAPKGVHRSRTNRTSRSRARRPGIKARRRSGGLGLLLLQVVGGHGAIRKRAVALRVGMVAGLLGEDEKLLLTNDGSKKASFL